ncbi:MAG: 2-C-methyl-D-erythritol 4-phosphate cytidylyltransferase [Pseudomonadota bacterium]
MVGAVIVAAGKGLRMQAATPKQYLALAGLPILCHTLRRFSACATVDAIALVVPESDHDYCRRHILSAAGIDTPIQLVSGGARRQDSVGNGLAAIGDGHDDDLVVIHDGVRPLVLPADIDACVRMAAVTGACIIGQPVADTLKHVALDFRIVSTIDRRTVWQAQTPQVFKRGIIAAAHRAAREQGLPVTDDSTMVESIGIPVTIMAAGNANIKITTPQDLELASALLAAAPAG